MRLIPSSDYLAVREWQTVHTLLCRLLVLRHQGRVGVIIADCGQFYIAYDENDPWASKVHFSVPELEHLVLLLEANPDAKWDEAMMSVPYKKPIAKATQFVKTLVPRELKKA